MNNRNYVTKNELLNTSIYVETMINKVRERLKIDHFTFSHFLVGSAGRNLATKTKEGFDLDYIFIFEKTKNKNVNITEKIKQKVLQTIEEVKSPNSKVNDSTSSIHYFSKNSQGNIKIESDICIMLKIDNKLFHIKGKGGTYHLEEHKNYKKLMDKFANIKKEKFEIFKKEYLININEKENDTPSFFVLLKTINEFSL